MFATRWLKFASGALHHPQAEISFAYDLFRTSKHSLFGGHLLHNIELYGLQFSSGQEFKHCMKRVWDQCKLHCKNAENNLLAHTIAELSEVRDGLADLDLDQEEINYIINDSCIS